MENDKMLKISVANSRKAIKWATHEIRWSAMIQKLSIPVRTTETFAEYKSLPKSKQNDIKDVGGFVGGELKDGIRRNGFVLNRCLITLDADNIPSGGTSDILRAVEGLGCAFVVYSTRKHESAAPRLRIILPLDTPCTADEYEPVARKIASFLYMDIFDPTTFEVVRFMYWPSISSDGEFVFQYGDKPFLSKDGMLNLYGDWRNIQEWPEVPGVTKLRERSIKKQANPLEKQGIVGAFCKVYAVPAAIDKFLNDVYEPCDGNRYTYAGGSTIGGAVLYDNGNFLYSHHATDPASGKLCNAFDLVRLHLFQDKDNDAKPDTPVTNLPSFKAMCKLALADNEVKRVHLMDVFTPMETQEEDGMVIDTEWVSLLEIDSKGGIKSTIANVQLILDNDPLLKGKLAYEEFSGESRILGELPWKRASDSNRIWSDSDYSGLRGYLETHYKIRGRLTIDDALNNHMKAHSYHEVREYFNSLKWDGAPRLDTMLIDYLGAPDTAFIRAVSRKSFVAIVARIFVPGIKFDIMPVFYSERQGIGKSTLLSIMGGEWYTDNLFFTDMNNKNGSEKLQGKMIVEIPELQGYKKSENESIKAFITRRVEHYRPAYGRTTIQRPRQCVIFGTTNTKEFLKDDTGNRRFWPVDTDLQKPTKKIFGDLEIEKDQLWAEAIMRWKIGEKLYVEGELLEAALQVQKEHYSIDPRESMILDFVNRKIPVDWYSTSIDYRLNYWAYGEKAFTGELTDRKQICAAEIWVECFRMPLRDMRQKDTREINTVLKSMQGWIADRPYFGTVYGRQRGFIGQIFNT